MAHGDKPRCLNCSEYFCGCSPEQREKAYNKLYPPKVDVDLFTFAFTAGLYFGELITTPYDIDEAINNAMDEWKKESGGE